MVDYRNKQVGANAYTPEQNLKILRNSDWSGGLGGAKPAPAPVPAAAAATAPVATTPPRLTGLAAGQAALKATGETAPSPLSFTGAPDNRSDVERAFSHGT
jgi:hypothetical protein